MPIDYSKFDAIDSDDDEEPRSSKSDSFEKLMQSLQELARSKEGEVGGGKKGVPPAPSGDPFGAYFGGALHPPPCEAPDPMGFDDMFNERSHLGSGLDPYADKIDLDLDAFKAEALELVVARFVSLGSAVNAAVSFQIESEQLLHGRSFRKALVAAVALSMIAESKRREIRSCKDAWVVSALVVEMVASYQLGDRDRAIELRDRLQGMRQDGLSPELKKSFQSTSEVLELVPNLLNLLQAAEAADPQRGRTGR
mmetsp:Transcript_22065/g.40542  ORF Transcript_22065/g.40542 Transcript_22065/m.40542 type:complete len:253 (-) Transcript_22065:14-772(-)